MSIEGTDPREINNIIFNLKSSSPGWDEIHMKVIKSVAPFLINPLAHVFNLSLHQGHVPSQLKRAKVIPLYKKGDKTLLTNHRPISVLPAFSKILEKLMYNRLLSYLSTHNILYQFQFGFRPKHGPNLALITLVDKIVQSLESGDYVCGLFLDFSKAFDTVNHKILFKKLYKYGIRGLPLEWLKSYLSDRSQFVLYKGTASPDHPVSCGIPQGSILGPILFLVYVNDIVNVSDKLFSILFADDTNIFMSEKNLSSLINAMNVELTKLLDWFHLNKLSTNLDKTHYIIFHTKNKALPSHGSIKINGQSINRVSSTKFLGIIIHENLNWCEHLISIRSKMSKGIGILYKSQKFLKSCTLLSLYHSFIYPYMTYCVEVWGSSAAVHINSIVKLQKKAARIISFSSFHAHSRPLFLKLNMLTLPEIYQYFILIFMYKYHFQQLPQSFNQFLLKNSQVHSINTRISKLYHIPKFRLQVSTNSIKCKGPIFWNSLPTCLYSINFYLFKKFLKKHLAS